MKLMKIFKNFFFFVTQKLFFLRAEAGSRFSIVEEPIPTRSATQSISKFFELMCVWWFMWVGVLYAEWKLSIGDNTQWRFSEFFKNVKICSVRHRHEISKTSCRFNIRQNDHSVCWKVYDLTTRFAFSLMLGLNFFLDTRDILKISR